MTYKNAAHASPSAVCVRIIARASFQSGAELYDDLQPRYDSESFVFRSPKLGASATEAKRSRVEASHWRRRSYRSVVNQVPCVQRPEFEHTTVQVTGLTCGNRKFSRRVCQNRPPTPRGGDSSARDSPHSRRAEPPKPLISATGLFTCRLRRLVNGVIRWAPTRLGAGPGDNRE